MNSNCLFRHLNRILWSSQKHGSPKARLKTSLAIIFSGVIWLAMPAVSSIYVRCDLDSCEVSDVVLTEHLGSIKWNSVLSSLDAHISYEYFLEEYYKACESYVPLRKLRTSNDPLWMNTNLKNLIKEKHRLWFKLNDFLNQNT